MTWRLHRTAYFASLLGERDGSDTTASSYNYAWDEFLEHVAPTTTLEDIPAAVAEYRSELRERGLAQNTVRNRIHSLKSYFRWCHEHRLISENPLAYFRAPREEFNPRQVVDEAILEPVLDQLADLPRNDRLVIGLSLFGGLRAGEVRRLRVRDIELEQERIHVNDGKGHKSRWVDIHDDLAPLLRREIPTETCPNCGYGPESSYLCTSYRSASGMIGKNAAWRIVNRWLRANPHRLRTTRATFSLEQGEEVTQLALELGHEDVNTTAGYGRGRRNKHATRTWKSIQFTRPPEQRREAV